MKLMFGPVFIKSRVDTKYFGFFIGVENVSAAGTF